MDDSTFMAHKRERERDRLSDRRVVLESDEIVGQDINEIINALACSLKSRLIRWWDDLERILTLSKVKNVRIKAIPTSFRAVDQGDFVSRKVLYYLKQDVK